MTPAVQYYLMNLVPLAFLFALGFFLFGMMVGWLYYSHYRDRSVAIENENNELRTKRDQLRSEYNQLAQRS